MAVAIPFIAAGASLAGTGIQAYGAVKQANARAEAENQQVIENYNSAAQTIEQARQEERNYRIIAEKEIGSQAAQLHGGGKLYKGSALDLISESRRSMEYDISSLRQRANYQAEAYKRGAGYAAQRGADARSLGGLAAAGTLLGGAGSAIGYLGLGGGGDSTPTPKPRPYWV